MALLYYAASLTKVFNELCCTSLCFLFHTSVLFTQLHATTKRHSTPTPTPTPVPARRFILFGVQLKSSVETPTSTPHLTVVNSIAAVEGLAAGPTSYAFNYQLSADYLFLSAKSWHALSSLAAAPDFFLLADHKAY